MKLTDLELPTDQWLHVATTWTDATITTTVTYPDGTARTWTETTKARRIRAPRKPSVSSPRRHSRR